MSDDRREEWLIDVTQTLETAGWQMWMKPALERELGKARRQLEVVAPEDVVGIATRQAEIRLLDRLLRDPKGFSRPPERKG